MGQPACYRVLVKNLSNLTSSYRAATLTDSETELLVKSYRSDELNVNLDIVTRHNHFNALRESNLASNVKSSDEELRTIVIVEWSMTATLFLLQHINLSLEVFVRSDGARFCYDFTSLDVLLVDATEKKTYIVSCLTLVKKLTEHLNASNSRRPWSVTETDEFYRVVDMNGSPFNTAGNYSSTSGNGEDVLDRHQEWLLVITNRNRNIFVNRIHELHYFVFPLFLSIESTEGRTTDNWAVVTIVSIECKQVAGFHFNEVKHLRIIYEVNLVQEDNDLRNVHLTSEKDMLACLRHWTVGSCYYEDCAIHLSGAGNHVLHIIGVAWAVNMRIVTLCGLVLDVCGVNGDATLFLLRSVIDLVERLDFLASEAPLVENLGNCGSQSRLTVVNMANCTDVDMRFCSLECFFCHNIMIKCVSFNI